MRGEFFRCEIVLERRAENALDVENMFCLKKHFLRGIKQFIYD